MLSIDEFTDFLSNRITQLRTAKGASARDMSLTLGQGAGYINSIENKNSMPSMHVFYFICEYFKISPKDFFDTDSSAPDKLNKLVADMKSLTPEQLDNIARIVHDIKR
ncbi:MAG: helix-turn-helix domain-containing protein [Defluviitaleaceae bacterium]|nr:helix-turn-helix domain-containing protein [Defluviitaleaceae bacterium]